MVAALDKNGKIHVTHINIRESIFFLLLKLILLDVIAAIIAVLYFSSVSNKFIPEIINNAILSYNIAFFLILVFLKIALSIYVVMRWLTEYYEIWPHAIIYRKGIFWRDQEKHPFAQMRTVKIEQGIFGKIFGFGTITLYNWYLEENVSMYLIHNPAKYFQIIESLMPKSGRDREIFLDETTQEGSS